MKKLLDFFLLSFCLIFFFCLTPTAFAEEVDINETNFPDEVFRNYISTNYDRDNDSALSETEISRIRSLTLPQKSISSIKGIEFFSSLTSLNCGYNLLTRLDVSNNTALTSLRCDSNQLTSLDVSKNTALTSLSCRNNSLTSLDVNNNTALTSLYCGNNQLTNLDISKNTALTSLDCYHNLLAELDVSYNISLNSLECDVNLLTELDISKNTALDSLECSNNQLKDLDISNNTALTFLHCNNNQLTNLDVSFCNRLRHLVCYSNHLVNLDICNCPKLVVLVCNSQPYTNTRGIRYGGSANGGYSSSDTILFYGKDVTLITPTPDLVLPASLNTISEEAFAGGAFRYVKLSEQTESIGPFAFANCPNLKYIYIPNETTMIDGNAFGDIQELAIFGKAGSTADDYAYYHDFTFIPIS